MLEALLRASPAGLSAEKLLEQAWDENADPFTNTVRVTIGRLRRKLGEPQVIHNDARHRVPDHLKPSEPGEQPQVDRPYSRIAHISAAPIKERVRTQAVTVPSGKQCGAPEERPSATRCTE